MDDLKKALLEKWGDTPPKEPKIVKKEPKEAPIESKLVPMKKKPKQKKTMFDDDFNADTSSELGKKALDAKFRQEIFKAEQLELKVEQERIKLQREAGGVIEYSMADYLFMGYMEKCNFQILTLLRKIEPTIKNLCQENEPLELIHQVQSGLEEILYNIKKDQSNDIKKWKMEL